MEKTEAQGATTALHPQPSPTVVELGLEFPNPFSNSDVGKQPYLLLTIRKP